MGRDRIVAPGPLYGPEPELNPDLEFDPPGDSY